jgi:hypothetical protein
MEREKEREVLQNFKHLTADLQEEFKTTNIQILLMCL